MIFDDAAQKMVLEFTCPTPVLGVRMKRDKVKPLVKAIVTKILENCPRSVDEAHFASMNWFSSLVKIVIVTRNQIHVFSFPNSPTKLFSLETRDNPLGLCEVRYWQGQKEKDRTYVTRLCDFLSGHLAKMILLGGRWALWGAGRGRWWSSQDSKREAYSWWVSESLKIFSCLQVDLYTTEQRVSSAPVTINAHKNELVCLAVSQQGGMVRINQKTQNQSNCRTSWHNFIGGNCKHKGDFNQNMGHSTKVDGYF